MTPVLAGLVCQLTYAKGEGFTLMAGRYANGRLALQLFDAEEHPSVQLTMNLPEAFLGEEEIYVKDYSENEGAVSFLLEAGIVQGPAKGYAPLSFLAIPRYQLTESFLGKLQEVGFRIKRAAGTGQTTEGTIEERR